MPRPWKRRQFIEGDEIVTLKKLVKVGDSFALIIPKDWLRFKTQLDEEGSRWVKLKQDGDEFILGGYSKKTDD